MPGVVQTTPKGKVYQLTLQTQPLYHPTVVTVTVHLPAGARCVGAGLDGRR